MLGLLLLACHHAAPPPAVVVAPPPPPPPVAAPFPKEGIGGAHWGFVDAVTDDGLYVVYYRFAPKSGDVPPTFDQHGMPDTAATPILREMATGKEIVLDRLVATSVNALVVQREGRFFLVKGGNWTLLDADGPALDETQDENVCLPPRTASFDATGRRVAYPTENGVAVRDLMNGERWEVPVPRVWRAWPISDGKAVVVMQVDGKEKGFPVQRTSCTCDWCLRFAEAYGAYGWGGPTFHPRMFSPDKPPTAADIGEVSIGETLVYHPKIRTVTSFDGVPISTADGCDIAAAAYGQPQLAVSCGTNPGKVWWPLSHKTIVMSVPIAPATLSPTIAIKDAEGHPRIPVMSGGRLSSLNLDDGSLKIGPLVSEIGLPSPGGLITARSQSNLVLFWLDDGRSRSLSLPADAMVVELGVRSIRLDNGATLVISDDGHSLWVPTASSRPDPNGCVLVPTSIQPSGVERGPWFQSCPPR